MWLIFLYLLQNLLWADHSSIILASGQTYTIKENRGQSVWVENGKVLQAEVVARGLMVRAQKAGRSLVRVGSQEWSFEVLLPQDYSLMNELQQKVNSMMGLSLQVENGKLKVQGKLLKFEDWLELSRLKNYTGHYAFCAQLPASIKEFISQHFAELFKNNALPILAIQMSPCGHIRVQKNNIFQEKLDQLLRLYGIEVKMDPQAVDILPLVRVNISIAELKKSNSRQFGVNWPSTYSAQIIKGTEDPLLTLQFLEREGQAKILARPNLLTRSGSQAEFMAGGEFAIKTSGYMTSGVTWKKYGILLKTQPQADFSGNMSISIETEISSIDDSKMVDGIPGLFTNRVKNQFDLSESKTIVLSGLIKSEDARHRQGLPSLGDLPIIGSLFSSRDFREDRSELVIMVKPEIITQDPLVESQLIKESM